MSADWVACSVRARAMTSRRLGRVASTDLAACPSLESAVAGLGHTAYGHDVLPGQSLAEAQRAVVSTVLWNIRVLAGWAPRQGVTMLRALLASVEMANVEDLLLRFAGRQPPVPYQLGGLSTAWSRLSETGNIEELRKVLATSRWGDPGSGSPRDIVLALRTTLADQVTAAVPAAGAWAAGSTALLLARTTLQEGHPLPTAARLAATRVLGPRAVVAGTLSELAGALPRDGAWALAGVSDITDLWRAEAAWWARVEEDGFALVRRAYGSEVLVGAVALLAADAWRVRAALELAARGGAPVEEFHAVA